MPVVLVALLATATAAVSLTAFKKLPSNGKIKAIGIAVYADLSQTPLTTLDWGVLSPGSNFTINYYVHNTGNHNITLVYTDTEWNPAETPLYVSTTWDYDGFVIEANTIIPVAHTVHVTADVTGIDAFSYLTTITGVEA